ncbi:MAG: barstar family protein [Coprococcus sp.]
MEIILDSGQLLEPEKAHGYLAERLKLPDYYGGNLDALYDCLTEIGEDTQLIMKMAENHKDNINMKKILMVMMDAENENPYLHVKIEPEAHQV